MDAARGETILEDAVGLDEAALAAIEVFCEPLPPVIDVAATAARGCPACAR